MDGAAGKRHTATPRFEELGVLLDGYFHEDFRLEHGSHEAAARAFVREASEGERDNVRKSLDAFLSWAEGVERETWQAALRRAGGAWRPRSLGPLREVRDVLGVGWEPGC